MLNHKNLNTEILKKYYLYFLTFYSVTLTYTTIFDFQTRYLVYSLSLFVIFEIKKFVIKNKAISLIFLAIIIHQFLQQPSFYSQCSLIVAICLFILVDQNLNFFKNNLIKIFYFSFYFLNFYLVLSLLFNQNLTDQFFYLDKINRNFIELMIVRCVGISFNTSNLIFSETSHLAIVYPTLFAAFLFYEKNLRLKLVFSLVYSFMCLITFSNTIFINNLILILIFFFFFKSDKNFFYEKLLVLMPIIFLTIFIFLNPSKCFQKINQLTINIKKYDIDNLSFENNFVKEKNFKSNKSTNDLNQIVDNVMNPSSFVYKFHFLLILENLKQNPFGVGFNNYKKNYEIFYNNQLNIQNIFKNYINLNYNDAASNGLKLFGEFGILILIPIILLVKFSVSLTIDKKIKLICLVLILSQAIRGAGYFTSGFMLVSFILICLVIKSKNSFIKKII